MRILTTGDWQVEHENLELCTRVVDEIAALKAKLGFSLLLHCGDVKHAYNPIDVRIVNFIVKAFGSFRKAGLDIAVCLGNHDRIGMHVDTQNWFPVLRRAGAKCFDRPGVLELTNGYEIRFLPFQNDTDLLRRNAAALARDARRDKSVLVFHGEIESARYSVVSRAMSGIRADDLQPQRYLAAIGGHIHLQQRVVDNVYYVGSPFATDWGEANQKKGYLLVDFEAQKVTRIPSEIPGWYDPAWPKFEDAKPASWKGTRIRVKVPVANVRSIEEELHRAKQKAEKQYQGAEIVCIPEIVQDGRGRDAVLEADWSDTKLLKAYADLSYPDSLSSHRERVLAYLGEQLNQAGARPREGDGLCFQTASAQNFLSFEKLRMGFEPGLCVVAGENRDWKGRSNGAGKSSVLQPLAVALFGVTFKGQKHDRWMRRSMEDGKSGVTVTLEDSRGRTIQVSRGRKPKKLVLKVNGEIIDNGNRPEQTQQMIEQVIGYTWETLSNAVYVDQSRAHLMLTGTEAERKDFLAKLQNLERFERARKLVKQDIGVYETKLQEFERVLAQAQTTVNTISATIQQLGNVQSLKVAQLTFNKAQKDLDAALEKMETWEKQAATKRAELEAKLVADRNRVLELTRQQSALLQKTTDMQELLQGFDSMEGKCPTCLRSVDRKYVTTTLAALEKSLAKRKAAFQEIVDVRDGVEGVLSRSATQLRAWQRNTELEEDVKIAALVHAKVKVELQRARDHARTVDALNTKMAAASVEAEAAAKKIRAVKSWLGALDYGEKVFARNGLPAYLNAQICPQLNQSAQKYSELFAQNEIQVVFAVDEEGRMDVQVVNAHGGENVQDQSEGELKMASLITSFAVRSIAPKTNLLILDEPGDGLDAVSARHFARGLKSVVDKFGTILLTSHNPNILGELSSERLVKIVKENGVSRIENG